MNISFFCKFPGIIYEIRTPLNAIVGFSDVIGSTYDELSEEERADFVRLISINSEHLVRLIDDILDLSKIESNTIKFTYSNYSLKSIMKDIEKEQVVKNVPEIEIKAILPDDDIYITTDATRLKQVICNFINNAILRRSLSSAFLRASIKVFSMSLYS